MWKSHTILPNVARLPELVPMFNNYCLGWISRDYRGQKLVYHNGKVFPFIFDTEGGVIGQVSRVAMIPKLQVGVVILTNQEVMDLTEMMSFTILDHFIEGHSMSELVEGKVDNRKYENGCPNFQIGFSQCALPSTRDRIAPRV